jgi:hypothetical protein|tara:strand:+ start:284 stop:433 length:150 start_codon:yes stop_codon:yes gene_type:complete
LVGFKSKIVPKKSIAFGIVSIWTMTAIAFTTISALQMIFLGKNLIALRG